MVSDECRATLTLAVRVTVITVATNDRFSEQTVILELNLARLDW